MATAGQNKDFTSILLPSYPLDEALDWIAKNMNPEDVFSDAQLKTWADENGWLQPTE